MMPCLSHLRESNSGPLLYESIALPAELRWQPVRAPSTGADDQDRTGDLVITNDVLYQLSYIGL